MTTFSRVADEFARSDVRYVLIGVSGANLHAHDAGVVFSTMDRDVFLPPDPENLLAAWQACERVGLQLTRAGESRDEPRDLHLAERVVERRAATRANDGAGLLVDITLVMAGHGFEEVWEQHRTYLLEGVQIRVARLAQIVASKAAVGREKDRLFLATHAEALRAPLPDDELPDEA